MAGLLGGGSGAVQQSVYSAIQLQTSAQGGCVPVYYGTSRQSINLIWYSGFTATKGSSGGKGGVLGAAAGKGSGNTYTYSANVALGVAEGPIEGYGQAWASKVPTTISSLGLTSFLGTYPQTPWGFVTTNYPADARPYTGLAYLGGAGYQLGSSAELPQHTFEVYGFYSARVVYTPSTIPSVNPRTITVGQRVWADGSTHSMWVSNISIPGFVAVGGAPSAGQYSVSGGVYTFNAADGGTAVIIGWNGKGQDADPSLIVADILSNADYGVGFPSAQVGELITNSESDAIPSGSHQIVVANSATFAENLCVYHTLGAQLFTCVIGTPGPLQYSAVAGTYTFNAADVGKTVEISYVSNNGLATFQSYCWAAGIFMSPGYQTQSTASSAIETIAKFANSEIVNTAGCLKLVPRGDKALTGNGHTYTPPLVVFNLNDDHFMLNTVSSGATGGVGGDDPVIVSRKRVSDQKNVVQLECLDRSNQYNPSIVDATDQAMVDQFGRRTTGSQDAHVFCDPAIAQQIVQLLLQQQAIRNTFAFVLPATFVWLDPMDIVTLTDVRLGLNVNYDVRILSVEEQDDGTLNLTAEEYAIGVANADSYEFAQGSGYSANYNEDPGSINTPIVFEPSVQLATNTGLEVWAAISGANPVWGGADVYVSSDGVTYSFVGRKWNATRQGVLTAIFPSHADPDTVNSLRIDLTESFASLNSGTVNDAVLGNTACLIDSEIVSFSNVTLTGTYQYTLDAYISRAQFGTAAAAHAIGAPIVRLDEQIAAIPYDKSQIGQTIYVKAVSFNLYGGGLQDLSVATAYPHVIIGPPLPGMVQNFAITQQGGPVIFTWTDLPDFVLKGYDILYGPTTGDINGALFLTQASRATEMTHANVPPGTWTFYIRGHDLADQVGPATSSTFTVRNFNFLIATQLGEPDWFGTLTNFVRHVSGVLVPQGQHLSSTYGWQVFDQFAPDPFATATFTGIELDSGADGDMRAFLTEIAVAAAAYGETGTPLIQGQLRWKTSSGSYNAYQDWTSGTITARYVMPQLVMDTSVRAYLTTFDLTLDGTPVAQTLMVTVDPAGTIVTWPTPFRNTPVVQVTPASAAATGGSAESASPTGALVKLWNGAVQVGGPAFVSATGV